MSRNCDASIFNAFQTCVRRTSPMCFLQAYRRSALSNFTCKHMHATERCPVIEIRIGFHWLYMLHENNNQSVTFFLLLKKLGSSNHSTLRSIKSIKNALKELCSSFNLYFKFGGFISKMIQVCRLWVVSK